MYAIQLPDGRYYYGNNSIHPGETMSDDATASLVATKHRARGEIFYTVAKVDSCYPSFDNELEEITDKLEHYVSEGLLPEGSRVVTGHMYFGQIPFEEAQCYLTK